MSRLNQTVPVYQNNGTNLLFEISLCHINYINISSVNGHFKSNSFLTLVFEMPGIRDLELYFF